mgnify:CR=1 FL=1
MSLLEAIDIKRKMYFEYEGAPYHVLDVEVSATKKTNLDRLLEVIGLQSEILDLKANPDREAGGMVVEAQLDKGRGPVATVLVQRGTLKLGDIFVAGSAWGRVRALVNDKGEPTRLALAAHAWGEPVPRTRAAAARLAAKGRNLLEKCKLQKD